MIRVVLSLMLLALPLLSAPALAQEQGDEPEIVQHMKSMNGILRQLRRLSRDAANKTAVLDMIEEFRGHALAAQKEAPLKTPDLPETEREAFVKEYRQTIEKMLSTLDQFKAAVEDEDVEQSQQILRRLFDWKKQGHDQFRKEEDTR
ncbi:MAG TPA: cytochrome b562 [Acidobacteriota bacterium]|nr:cytochrome b562 [Acidobacteriota bacterium]